MVGVRHRILQLLSERPRDKFTTLQLARDCHTTKGNMRVTLYRLAKANKVARIAPGIFQHPSGLVYPGAPDPRLRIHALKVECRCNEMGGWSSRRLLRVITDRFPSPSLHRHPNNGSITTKGEWATRLLTITAHPRHEDLLLEVFMEASRRPLHLIEVHSYLAGFIPGRFDIPPEFWMVKQADWNIDIPGTVKTGLDFTNISIASFEKIILKIYQKAEDMVRIEVRSFQPIMARRIVDYTETILNTLEEIGGEPAGPEVR